MNFFNIFQSKKKNEAGDDIQSDTVSTKSHISSDQTQQSSFETNKNKKLFYIDQKEQEWPQWSVSPPVKQYDVIPEEKQDEDVFQVMHTRCLDRAFYKKLENSMKIAARKTRQNLNYGNMTEQQKKAIDWRKEINKNIKGWRNWEDRE